MSNNKKMIYFYCIMLIIAFLLSIALSLDKEFYWIEIRYSSLWFTIITGIVSGLVVAIAAEFRQYKINKRSAETSLFYSSINLYYQISILDTYISYCLQNETSQINITILAGSQITTPITNSLQQLRYIDYSPFCKPNKIKKAFNNIINNWSTYNRYIIDLSNIHILYNKIKIENIQSDKSESNITCQNEIMKNALKTASDNMCKIKDEIFAFCRSYPEKRQKEYDLAGTMDNTEKACKQFLINLK